MKLAITKQSTRLWVFVLFASLFLAACAPAPASTASASAASATQAPTPLPATAPVAEGITLTDGLDRAITLAAPAQRIVSLAPSNTEILYSLGAGPQVVGRDDFSDYPAEAAQLPSIGGSMGKFNSEAIVGLNPDLVLASQLNTAEQVQALEKLGLTVYLLPNPTDFDGLYANLVTVGKLTGRQAEAEKLVESLQARVAAVTQKVAPLSYAPVVFYELDASNPNAPYTSGPGTFINTLINMAGGINLGSSLKDAYAQISLEELVVQNPEIILLGDAVWGGVTAESVAQRAGWEKLAAVQNGRVLPFDDNLVSRPGPRMVDGLEALARAFHPDIFK